MNTSVFLEQLREELEEDEIITVETKFKQLESYDSLSILSIIVFIDKNFGKKLDVAQFKEIQTIQELKELIGLENFED